MSKTNYKQVNVHIKPRFDSKYCLEFDGTRVRARANLLATNGSGQSMYGYVLTLQLRFFNGNKCVAKQTILSGGTGYSSIGERTSSYYDASRCTHCQIYMVCSSDYCDIAGRTNYSGYPISGTKYTFAWSPKNVAISNGSKYQDNASLSSYTTAIKINWTLPSNSPKANKVAYAYKKSSESSWTVVQGTNTTNKFPDSRQGTVTLTKLISDTKYDIALIAGNDTGWSADKISEGATITIKTRQNTPIIKPTAKPQAHQITVSWTSDIALKQLMYLAECGENNDLISNNITINPAAKSGSFVISNLTPGKKYDITVWGFSNPDGIVSSKKHVYATCTAPKLTVSCTKKANTTNTFVVTWNANMSLKTIKDTIKKSNGSIYRATTSHTVSGTKGTYEIKVDNEETYKVEFQGIESPKGVETNTVTKTLSAGELPSINKIYNQPDKTTFVFGEPSSPSITVSITGGTGFINVIRIYNSNNSLLGYGTCKADSAVTIPLSQESLDALYKTFPRSSSTTTIKVRLMALSGDTPVKTEERDKTCVLRGNAKTAHVGSSTNTPHRAKIWVGSSTNTPHRAVAFVGSSTNTPHRTI